MSNKLDTIGLKKYLDAYFEDAGGYAEFKKMAYSRMYRKDIAEHFGVSSQTIYNWMKRDKNHE